MVYRGRALENMLSNAEIYEYWKQYLSRSAKFSIGAAIITGVCAVLFLVVGGYHEYGVPIRPDYLVDFTEDWSVAIQYWCYYLARPLIIGNVINIGIALAVLAISQGTTKPVREPIHWLAHASAIQAGITIVVATIAVIVSIVIFLINVIAGICMTILFFGGLFGAMGSGGSSSSRRRR